MDPSPDAVEKALSPQTKQASPLAVAVTADASSVRKL